MKLYMHQTDMSDGAVLLGEYLERKTIKKAKAAEELKTSVSAIHYWLKGGQRPRGDMRDLIESWSSGAVPADSWLTPKERARKADQKAHDDEPASERNPTQGKEGAA